MHLICIRFGQNFKFRFDSSYDCKLLTSFPAFHESIFCYWSPTLCCSSRAPFLLRSLFLRYSKNILISNKLIHFKHFSFFNPDYVTQLFYNTGSKKEWVKLKHELNLNNNLYFNWMQLIYPIPQNRKKVRISKNLLFWNTIC